MNQINLLRLENKYKPETLAILGSIFFEKVEIDDLENGTDFAVYRIKPKNRIANRWRDIQYHPRYGNQFTIRWELPSGGRTERHKIQDFLVDYLLYGFVDEFGPGIVKWKLIDLEPIATNYIVPSELHQNNTPDKTTLAAFDLDSYPKDKIIKVWQRPGYKLWHQV